jgi:hypothetical protein
MADIVNLQDRLKAKQDEDAKYLERMDLTSRMIPVMVETVEKFASMGASPGHIIRFLQATIDEINNSEGPKQRWQGLGLKVKKWAHPRGRRGRKRMMISYER